MLSTVGYKHMFYAAGAFLQSFKAEYFFFFKSISSTFSLTVEPGTSSFLEEHSGSVSCCCRRSQPSKSCRTLSKIVRP